MPSAQSQDKPSVAHRISRAVGIAVAVGIALIALTALTVTLLSKSRAKRSYPVNDVAYTVYDSPEDLIEGERLSKARACAECHGSNLAGHVASDELPMMRMIGPNLTGGQGSVIQDWSDEDIVRVLRYGVYPDGRAAFFMPAHEYFSMPDKEMGQILAYLRSLDPIDNDPGKSKLGIIGRVLHVTGAMPMYPAENMDHDKAPSVIDTSSPLAYGEYLANSCRGCHGAGLSGGDLPGAPSSIPAASNLTPHESGLGSHTLESFTITMRTGVAPDGRELSSFMPFENYASMTDDELSSLWEYFNSLPAAEFGGR